MADNMFESLGNNTSEIDQTEINCCGKVVAVFICQKCYRVVHGIRVKEIDGPFLGCCESNKSRYENGIPNVMELVKRTLLSALSRKKIQQEPEINPVTDESEKTKELKKELVKGKNRSVEDDTSVQADDASISTDDASTEGDDMLWNGDDNSQNKKSSPGPKRDLGEKQSIENKIQLLYSRTNAESKVSNKSIIILKWLKHTFTHLNALA
ncbi:hypothetical protein JTB14_020097 [Gonioctena quinquepunctata]|nr:hypothetical protein JTB14_020097 [Gonioctena quinquepunctata]